MITEAFLYFFTIIIKGANALLPDASFSDTINNVINTTEYYITIFNIFLPISAIQIFIAFVITLEFTILILYGVNLVVKIVRGSG